MKTSLKISMIFAVVFATPGLLWAQRVAVLGENWNNQNEDVRSKLEATGFFESVDSVDLINVTPSLEDLQAYCAVLAFTSEGAGDEVALGNNLADYIDAGGGVVGAVLATASIPFEGRFNDENYWAILPTGQQQVSQAALGEIFVPEHPILAGVSSFDGGFDGGIGSLRPSLDALHPQAERVANWTGADHIPLIATRVINGVARVDLGFFPISSDISPNFWDSSTDGARIMANALLYVCDSLDLGVTKTASANPVEVGDELVYTLLVTNNGPGDATGVVLTDHLPAGVDFVSAESITSCGESAGVVTCTLGDLPAGVSTTVTVIVAPQSEGTITNQASVVSNQTDTNPDNDEALANVSVLPRTLPNSVSGGACSLGTGASVNVFPWLGLGAVLLSLVACGRIPDQMRTAKKIISRGINFFV